MSRKPTIIPGAPKLSDIASQAKRYYIPKIEQDLPHLAPRSYGYSDVASLNLATDKVPARRLRVAVLDADAVDIALQWNHEDSRHQTQDLSYTTSPAKLRIPLILGVDEKRAGGNWESSCIGPEENVCRRSNLVRCLARVRASPADLPIYPIPSRGGIYAPQVVVYRCGPSGSYNAWDLSRWEWLPIISVAPGRRPKVRTNTKQHEGDDSESAGSDYIFAAERELMRDKIRTALRLAAIWGHRDIVIGPFGLGPGFYNPPRQLSAMWKQVLFEEEEFRDVFDNVVFAIEHVTPSPPPPSAVTGLAARTTAIKNRLATDTNADHHQGNNNMINTSSKPPSMDEHSSTDGNSTSSTTDSSHSNSSTGSETSASSQGDSSISSLSSEGAAATPAMSDYEIFKEEFAPKRLCKINLSYRKQNMAVD